MNLEADFHAQKMVLKNYSICVEHAPYWSCDQPIFEKHNGKVLTFTPSLEEERKYPDGLSA